MKTPKTLWLILKEENSTDEFFCVFKDFNTALKEADDGEKIYEAGSIKFIGRAKKQLVPK